MTHFISPKLSNRQDAFIKGTILGGSSVVKPSKGKNCYLSMRNKNFEWLRYKATELQSVASPSPITTEKTNRWHSTCYPIFNEYRQMFYSEKSRCLKLNSLELLRDVTIAIWYGDCGNYNKGHVIINTHIWGENGTNIITEYFGLLDYQTSIFKERGSFRVKLNKDASIEFMRLVSPHLPKWIL